MTFPKEGGGAQDPTQVGPLIKQLSEMRNEARKVGSRVAEDALSHAIACAAKGKRADMQRWIEAAISELRRVSASSHP
jgi:hypothetical protein